MHLRLQIKISGAFAVCLNASNYNTARLDTEFLLPAFTKTSINDLCYFFKINVISF